MVRSKNRYRSSYHFSLVKAISTVVRILSMAFDRGNQINRIQRQKSI